MMHADSFVYIQTTPFTCGPAALMTALAALDPAYRPARVEEMTIWRESNLIFMGEGHAGCGAFGLACAGLARGAVVDIYGRHMTDTLFSCWAKTPDEAAVQSLMTVDDRARFLERGGRLHDRGLDMEWLAQMRQDERELLVLTGTGVYGHWVLVDRVFEDGIDILDPYKANAEEIATRPHHTDQGRQSMSHADFLEWASYGPERATAVIALSKPATA